MTTEIIVFLERNTFNVPFRKPAFDHEWSEFGETAPGEVVERLAPATIAICNKLPLRAETLAQLPNLRLIAVAATGVASRQAMQTLADQLIDNLEAFVKREPRNLV